MSETEPVIKRRFVSVPDGEIHLAEAGEGLPVLLLHQTPRSWEEYREVLPLLAPHVRAIAMDTIGFGESTQPPWPPSIDGYARVVVDVLDALGLDRVALVGHHTGGVIAVEVAATAPDRVDRLVLSSTPYADADFRRRRAERPLTVDAAEPSADGSHLVALWQSRAPFYPPCRPELLERCVLDGLRAGPSREAGHRAVHDYRMEDQVLLVRSPVLLVGATEDPYAYPELGRLAAVLDDVRVTEIDGGMVPLPDGWPAEFAEAIIPFLTRV
jgi:pimeloyl-ACP methyl ester carboxylesterase